MNQLTQQEIIYIMDISLFIIGLITFLAGIWVLLFRAVHKDLDALTTETAQIAKKGFSDGISGLVGNASSLLDSLNQLVRTTRGIGVFLTLTGLALITAALWLAFQIN